MANVKITDLTAIAGADLASNDVLPIVDINVDQTKKVAISDLQVGISDANDFVTFTRLDANINVVQDNAAAIETRRAANVTLRDNEDTALQARITANASVAASNDFITFTRLDANVNTVQDNVVATEANVVLVRSNVDSLGSYSNTTFSTVTNAAALATAIAATGTDFQPNINTVQDNVVAAEANVVLVRSNIDSFAATTNTTIDTISTNLTANLVQATANTDAVETRRADNVFFTLNLTGQPQANIIINDANVEPTSNNTYSLGAPDKVWKELYVGPGSIFVGANTAFKTDSNGDIRIVQSSDDTPRTLVVDKIDIGTGTNKVRLENNNGKLKQKNKGNPNVEDDSAAQGDLDNVQSNVTAVEARRVANIAGAVSSVLTSDLTVSRAVVSDGSGKIAVSAVTSTEIGHLDGVTSSIQTQLDAKAALSGAAFTGEVTMSDDLIVTGNLTINGDQTVINTTNMDVDDTLIMLANGTTGSPANDIGILFNRGNQGNAAFFYDESAKTFKISDTQDPSSNTTIHPVTSSNLDVGRLTAATVEFNGADLSTAITDNVSTLNTSIAAVETRRTNNIAGAISTVLTSDLTASRALIAGTGGKIEVSAVTATELGYLDGVTSAIQTQFTAAETRRTNNIAGAISTVLTSDLTGDRVMITDGSGKISASSGVTPTELGMIDGITLGTTAASKAVTTDANGDTNFTADVDVDGNVTIGTNTSNTLTIVGSVDLGTL